MNKELERVEDVFLERVNQICREFGLNNIMAQLFVVLYFSDKPLSLNDMSERLKISKASVSINIRSLERYGAARRVWQKGSRRDYYEAELDIYKVVVDRAKSMLERRIAGANDIIDTSFKALNAINVKDSEEKESIKVFKQRLNALKSLQNKTHTLFNLFNSQLLGHLLGGRVDKSQKQETMAPEMVSE